MIVRPGSVSVFASLMIDIDDHFDDLGSPKISTNAKFCQKKYKFVRSVCNRT